MASDGRHITAGDQWAELAFYFDDDHERGNSPSRRLPTYQRMLVAFRPIWKAKVSGAHRGRYLLSKEKLIQILTDAYPPGSSGPATRALDPSS